MTSREYHQYMTLKVIVVLVVIVIAVDSLIESRLLRYLPKTGLQLPPNSQRPHQVVSHGSDVVDENHKARYFQLPVDHHDMQAGFFQNRYWVNDEFYKAGGPVFVHDNGESSAELAAQKYLFGPHSHLINLMQEFGGIGIVWEHRCYGESSPSSISIGPSFDQLRTLTFKQALADIPYFAQGFALSNRSDVDLAPSQTPWIIMGCSYSGLRAAASRLLYPDTFFAAYAASAPAQLQIELATFFDVVYDKMVDRGYTQCAVNLHSIMLHMDTLLTDPESAISVKRLLLGPGAEENTNGNFALAVANIFSYFQSYGITGGLHSLGSLCTHLAASRNASSSEGLEEKGELLETFASWPGLKSIVNDHFNVSCGFNDTRPSRCDLDQTDVDAGSISWTWQLCSELGLFVTQNTGPSSLVSRFMSLAWRMSLCKQQFPQLYAAKLLSDTPPVETLNQLTGGFLMRPSNTFWTAGEYDPWRNTTMFLTHKETRDTLFSVTEEIPEANTSTGVEMIFGRLLADAQHCYDWTPGFEEAERALDLFSRSLKRWLIHYRPGPLV